MINQIVFGEVQLYYIFYGDTPVTIFLSIKLKVT